MCGKEVRGEVRGGARGHVCLCGGTLCVNGKGVPCDSWSGVYIRTTVTHGWMLRRVCTYIIGGVENGHRLRHTLELGEVLTAEVGVHRQKRLLNVQHLARVALPVPRERRKHLRRPLHNAPCHLPLLRRLHVHYAQVLQRRRELAADAVLVPEIVN